MSVTYAHRFLEVSEQASLDVQRDCSEIRELDASTSALAQDTQAAAATLCALQSTQERVPVYAGIMENLRQFLTHEDEKARLLAAMRSTLDGQAATLATEREGFLSGAYLTQHRAPTPTPPPSPPQLSPRPRVPVGYGSLASNSPAAPYAAADQFSKSATAYTTTTTYSAAAAAAAAAADAKNRKRKRQEGGSATFSNSAGMTYTAGSGAAASANAATTSAGFSKGGSGGGSSSKKEKEIAAAAAAAAAVAAAAAAEKEAAPIKYCRAECTVPDSAGLEMVGCDHPAGCPYGEWFHLSCVGLKFAPAGDKKWYCPECKPQFVAPRKR